MAFKDLEFVAKPASSKTDATISYRRRAGKNGSAKGGPKLWITIPKAKCAPDNPKAAQTYTLQLGEGSDAGKGRIVPAPVGVQPNLMKGTARFGFGFVPMLGDDAAEAEPAAVRSLAGGGFEISLPLWFKADVQAEKTGSASHAKKR